MNGLIKPTLKKSYGKMPNTVFTDRRLSANAVRVLGYLWSKKDGWNVYNQDVIKRTGVGKNSLTAVWKLLLDTKWITRELVKTETGNIYEYKLYIIEEPLPDNVETPPTHNMETPLPETGVHSITESNKTKGSNNDNPTATPKIPNWMKYHKNSKNTVNPNIGSSSDLVASLKEVQDINPKVILEKYKGDFSKSAMPRIWKELVRHHHPKLKIMGVMSGKDVGLLHLVAKHLDKDDRYDKLAKVIKYWDTFTKHCTDAHGGFNPPDYPNPYWVHKHMYALNTFHEEEVFDEDTCWDDEVDTSNEKIIVGESAEDLAWLYPND